MPNVKQKSTIKANNSAKPKVRIKITAFDHKIADQSTQTIVETAERTGALVAGPIPLPSKIKKYTLNRSTFVHKDARDQYEIRIHKRLIDITDITPKTIDSLSNLNLPINSHALRYTRSQTLYVSYIPTRWSCYTCNIDKMRKKYC